MHSNSEFPSPKGLSPKELWEFLKEAEDHYSAALGFVAFNLKIPSHLIEMELDNLKKNFIEEFAEILKLIEKKKAKKNG